MKETRVFVRMSDETRRKLARLAKEEKRSLSNMALLLIENALETLEEG